MPKSSETAVQFRKLKLKPKFILEFFGVLNGHSMIVSLKNEKVRSRAPQPPHQVQGGHGRSRRGRRSPVRVGLFAFQNLFFYPNFDLCFVVNLRF